jgi:hypothetical protein
MFCLVKELVGGYFLNSPRKSASTANGFISSPGSIKRTITTNTLPVTWTGKYKWWRMMKTLNTRYIDSVPTSQETHYVSATKPNQLTLFGETVVVYCENHTEHTDTVRISQETNCSSATEPNRLMLLGDTVAVYCEYNMEHTITLCGQTVEFVINTIIFQGQPIMLTT